MLLWFFFCSAPYLVFNRTLIVLKSWKSVFTEFILSSRYKYRVFLHKTILKRLYLVEILSLHTQLLVDHFPANYLKWLLLINGTKACTLWHSEDRSVEPLVYKLHEAILPSTILAMTLLQRNLCRHALSVTYGQYIEPRNWNIAFYFTLFVILGFKDIL